MLLFYPVLVMAGPGWDMVALSGTPETYPSEQIKSVGPGIRAIFFKGLPYHGKPTRIFAWIGIPKTRPGEKVPGMVLVHGGCGTASQEWVKLWMDRGYAAIAMDTCGALPEPKTLPRHEYSGPPGWGGFDQIAEKPEDQWTYHAVADVILAHSLLRSQPGVDAARIGLTGISWGGYLTCIAASVDARFCFAVPVYGCGHYRETACWADLQKRGGEKADRWMKNWDASNFLPGVKVPVLWVTGSSDFTFWLPALQASYRMIPQERRTLAVRLRMQHDANVGSAAKEIAIFADSLLKGGAPLATIIAQTRADRQITVTFESRRPITKAELNITADTVNPWPKREWKALPAAIKGNTVTAELPADARFYYVNLFDDRDCVVSTEHGAVTP